MQPFPTNTLPVIASGHDGSHFPLTPCAKVISFVAAEPDAPTASQTAAIMASCRPTQRYSQSSAGWTCSFSTGRSFRGGTTMPAVELRACLPALLNVHKLGLQCARKGTSPRLLPLTTTTTLTTRPHPHLLPCNSSPSSSSPPPPPPPSRKACRSANPPRASPCKKAPTSPSSSTAPFVPPPLLSPPQHLPCFSELADGLARDRDQHLAHLVRDERLRAVRPGGLTWVYAV